MTICSILPAWHMGLEYYSAVIHQCASRPFTRHRNFPVVARLFLSLGCTFRVPNYGLIQPDKSLALGRAFRVLIRNHMRWTAFTSGCMWQLFRSAPWAILSAFQQASRVHVGLCFSLGIHRSGFTLHPTHNRVVLALHHPAQPAGCYLLLCRYCITLSCCCQAPACQLVASSYRERPVVTLRLIGIRYRGATVPHPVCPVKGSSQTVSGWLHTFATVERTIVRPV